MLLGCPSGGVRAPRWANLFKPSAAEIKVDNLVLRAIPHANAPPIGFQTHILEPVVHNPPIDHGTSTAFPALEKGF